MGRYRENVWQILPAHPGGAIPADALYTCGLQVHGKQKRISMFVRKTGNSVAIVISGENLWIIFQFMIC
jgi:hypothetical protein